MAVTFTQSTATSSQDAIFQRKKKTSHPAFSESDGSASSGTDVLQDARSQRASMISSVLYRATRTAAVHKPHRSFSHLGLPSWMSDGRQQHGGGGARRENIWRAVGEDVHECVFNARAFCCR